MSFGQRGDVGPGRLFRAKYHGTCWECTEEIEPGDYIGYVDDEVCCEECWKEAQ